jgi:hypothetical protein
MPLRTRASACKVRSLESIEKDWARPILKNSHSPVSRLGGITAAARRLTRGAEGKNDV